MKNNKGAISLFTLLSMLFFLFFIMVAYNNVSSKGKMQVETVDVLKSEYKNDVEAKEIYTQMNGGMLPNEESSEREVILKTEEEKNIVNDEINHGYLYSNGKIYEF